MPESALGRFRLQSSVDDVKSLNFWKALFAEFLGTFLLVFVGGCSCTSESKSIVGIALTFGLAVGTIVWGIAHISGGHINPAVTLGMLIARRVSIVRAVLYIIIQCLGAIAGAALMQATMQNVVNGPNGVAGGPIAVTKPMYDAKLDKLIITVPSAFFIELIITFVLVFVVFATCDSKRTGFLGSGPLAIGLSLTMCHIPFAALTGSSMNPARSLGPAIVYNDMQYHWIYWAGPLLGGILAALLYELLFAANTCMARTKAWLLNARYNPDAYVVPSECRTDVHCEESVPIHKDKDMEQCTAETKQ